jgi:CRISPR-associated endonuclease Csy4
MRYYLDITLLPDAEVNLGFLWQKVYQQVHIALVENKIAESQSAIAASFPKYGDREFPLGNTLRLLANEENQLKQFDIEKWLSRLADYTHLKSIKEVPVGVTTFARFKRVQFDTNIERLARRRAKRKDESIEDALAHYSGFKDQQSKLPFVNLKSSKGGQFRLFIQREIVGKADARVFNCYGLSRNGEGTIPWF